MKPIEKGKKEQTQASKADKILKERAEVLARRPKEEDSGEMLDIVEFRIGGERYAIESIHIREVFPLRDITPVPGTPDFVIGIINVRGQIVSLVDLKVFFELPHTGLHDSDQVILLHRPGMEFGVVVKDIAGSRRLLKSCIQPALPTMVGVREEFIIGITDEQCVLLNGRAILTDSRIIVDSQ